MTRWIQWGLIVAAVCGAARAAENSAIQLAIEEPASGSIYSGVGNLRGWAVAPVDIDRLELYVDGVFVTHVPSGGARADVAAQFPSFPEAAQSGFSMAFNYSNQAAGAHTLRVRAIDINGDHRDASASYSVARFPDSFISDPNRMDASNAQASFTPRTVVITGLLVDGVAYDLQLDWRTATQGFAITGIAAAGTGLPSTPPGAVSASLTGRVTSATNVSGIHPGEAVTVAYSFDPAASDFDPADPSLGLYEAVQTFSLTVAGHTYTAQSGTLGFANNIIIASGFPAVDTYSVTSGPPLSGPSLSGLAPFQVDINVADSSAAVFSDDRLATDFDFSFFDIRSADDFSTAGGRLLFRDAGSGIIGSVSFAVESLSFSAP